MTATDDRPPVTVIGLGAMGRALAGAFLSEGHPTTVWNRSPHKADELVARGAARASTVGEAVAASPLVVVCVLDHEVGHDILRPVADALSGRALVDLTSDTPERARRTAAWAAEHGIDYLDGAIMVPVEVIGLPDALLLYSGSQTAFEAHEATLRALGGNARYLGDDHGTAALYDLAMLDIFYSSMASIVHAFALVGSEGIAAATFLPYANEIAAILPAIVASTARDVDAGEYPGDQGNLAMEAAGIDHIIQASLTRGLGVDVLTGVRSLAERAIADGHGADGFSSVIDVIKDPTPAA